VHTIKRLVWLTAHYQNTNQHTISSIPGQSRQNNRDVPETAWTMPLNACDGDFTDRSGAPIA